jgi:UDP-2,3-diacylglucosamine pyrophosphatase LpxH
MITNIHEPRLLVTSDTHIGNHFCHARPGLIQLLNYAQANKYNVCINGDGIDVLQTSVKKMSIETAALLREFRRIAAEITIYYTVGNHDIVLEHCLGDWGGLHFVPFLNVTSGNKRIRIEHGHLYDPFLMKHPELQPALTRFIGFCARLHPWLYTLDEPFKRLRYRYVNRLLRINQRPTGRSADWRDDENPSFLEAAEELAQRGFDFVIFGHTHHAGVVPLNGNRASYVNPGSWFQEPHYIVINDGDVSLKPWRG